ncbi:hypothetical protein MMC26_007644, partial [Xylographa opegraphella]|nr:hypothetical protein [Xylographa opegraphella]
KYTDLIQLFVITLDKDAPPLDRFDGLTDQYNASRTRTELNHNSSFVEVECLGLMKAVQDYEKDWVLISSFSSLILEE